MKIAKNKYVAYLVDFILTFLCAEAAVFLSNNYHFSINGLIYGTIISFVTVIVFMLFKLYRVMWEYAGMMEYLKLTTACLVIFIINIVVTMVDNAVERWHIINFQWTFFFSLFQVDIMGFLRIALRLIKNYKKGNTYKVDETYDRVMLIGAGDASLAIIREMRNNSLVKLNPVCIIDDDKHKKGQLLENVPVVGSRNDIVDVAKKERIEKIIIAIPSASRKDVADIIKICQETKCKMQVVPGLETVINGDNKQILTQVRDVQVEDLLGREPIKVNLDEITGYLTNKTVLVTGGGGSIGSELCRQIAGAKPRKLIIFDIYENNAYEIEQELKRKYQNDLDLLVLIGSVRDKVKVEDLFSKYRPDIVFHAAAHKHVPLMETSPNEAIKNNVFGTLNVAQMADKYGTKRFVMISTDKAVNPTNIMGASKRICEMIVQAMSRNSKTEFVATRFGNVLGSNGSVIPLFKKQIASGGPVTVTHKDIVRYFMTIPEAVSLVLQAGSYAKGGEIFVLDMGEPVKIYDLAVNLIRLSGYTPGVNMDIKITGLRPGEKLYEEMLMKEEGMKNTPNNLIHIGHQIDVSDSFFDDLALLDKACHEETDNMKDLVAKLVPTYHRQG